MAKISKKRYEEIITYRDYVNSQIYTSRPVDIIEFVENPLYLGHSFGMGSVLRPCWKKYLREIFYDNGRYLVVLTGAIGTGKSTAAIIILAYCVYLLLLLKDPWRSFNLSDGGKMTIAFFNLTKTLGQSKGFNLLQSYMLKSDWFRKHPTAVVRGDKDLHIEFSLINFVLASPNAKGFGIQGENVVSALLDEVDSPIESENSKMRVMRAYESTVRRFDSRFVIGGKTLGKFCLVASKQDTMGFINIFIEQMKNSPRMYVVDIPLWEARNSQEYCGKRMPISIGDQYNPPKFLNTQEEINQAKINGYHIVEVPVEYREDFERDIIGSLRDIAGISVKSSRKNKLFSSEDFIKNSFDLTRQDPIRMPTIEIGLKDDIDLLNFIDFSKLTVPKHIQRYIHGDIGFSEDAFGLAMACVYGSTEVRQQQPDGTFKVVRVPVAFLDFVMRIKARDGEHVPLHKIRKLVLDLKTIGYNIQEYSSDLKLAAEDTFQILENAGIKTKYLSMDKPVENYLDFRNIVIEKRVNLYRHDHLFFELKHLEYDRSVGKVDHPNLVKDVEYTVNGDIKDVVLTGSKDLADAAAGACLNALRSNIVPIDTDFMSRAIAGQMTNPNADDPLQRMMTVNGKQVIGTIEGGNLKKFNEILKGIV